MADAALLEVKGVSKRFVGTLALDGVDFDVKPGEIHALLGQNGAGKSTLIKLIAGVYPPDAGRVLWRGHAVGPGAAGRMPIAFIHQDLGLVDTMTVAENVAIQAGYRRAWGLIDWRASNAAASRALAAMGSAIDPRTRVTGLSAADRSIVAIARALVVRADLLVLDEPTASLPAADVERLLATLRRLRAGGISMIYVTHRLDEVFRLADRVTVLRDGRRITTAPVAATSAGQLVLDIVGRAVAETTLAPAPIAAAPMLRLERVVVPAEEAGLIGPISFTAAAGEILALVGLRGAGHHAIGRAVFGAMNLRHGRILLGGSVTDFATPAAAMAAGIGFVSSRRAEESMAATLTVQENLYLNPRARGIGPLRPIRPRGERTDARRALARFAVRPPEPSRPIITLSGGNQQKVVVARWMEARIRLLILEEPTIGVDVGAKAEIYRDLNDALRDGLVVLLISSDFEEVEKIAHRALVFSRGLVIADLPRADLTVARLTQLAAGGTDQQPEVA